MIPHLPTETEQRAVATDILDAIGKEKLSMDAPAFRAALSNECRTYFRDRLSQADSDIDEFFAEVDEAQDPTAELTAVIAMQRTASHFGLDLLMAAACAQTA